MCTQAKVELAGGQICAYFLKLRFFIVSAALLYFAINFFVFFASNSFLCF